MRSSWLSTFSLAIGLLGLPQAASAQIFVQPPHVRVYPRPWWIRPRVVIVPPVPVRVRLPAPVPYCCAPPVVVQPYAPPPYPPQPYAPQPYAQPYAQPPCCVQPPPPPVYQPEPPPLPPPPPVYQSAPLALPPPVVLRQPALAAPVKPPWRNKFGIGGRFAGLLNTDSVTQSKQLGFGGELLFRVARHLSLEVAAEGQRSVDDGFARWDIPVTFGMRVHIGPPEWVVSPYFVFASGLDYARLDFLRAQDIAWFLEGQAGGGLEIRLGHRFALTGDVRGVGRVRLTEPAEAVAATTAVNGKPFSPMQNQGGVQFRLGAAVYF